MKILTHKYLHERREASTLVMTTKMGSYISNKFLLLSHVHRGTEKNQKKGALRPWEPDEKKPW
jgi:hypothetical protein